MMEAESFLDRMSPILIMSILTFIVTYALGYFVFFSKWKGKFRYEAASCCISLLHGTVTTVMAAYDVYSTKWKLDAPNTRFENILMEYSIAYFLVDLTHYLYAVPNDYLFIFHHIATSTYMASCRYFVGHGGKSVSALIAVGEVTSPFQNVWTIARMGRDRSPTAKKIYVTLSPFFTVMFTFFRGVLGPWVVWQLSKFYLLGGADGSIPRWLTFLWMAKSALAIFGSFVWVYKLWAGLLRFYARGPSKGQQLEQKLAKKALPKEE